MALLTRHSVGAHQGNDLVRNSPGNPRPQSSQPAEPPRTDHWQKKSGTGACKLMFTEKKRKKKKSRAELFVESFPFNLALEERPQTHTYVCNRLCYDIQDIDVLKYRFETLRSYVRVHVCGRIAFK